MTVFAHIFILACILCLIAYRDNNGCQIFWFIIYAICYILLLIGLGSLGREYSQCNREPYNLCNDLKLCCKNEIHTNPAFGCKNTLDCPVDPKPNADFEGLFWLHFILFVMQCVWLGVYLYFLIDKKKEEKEEEEDKIVKDETKETPQEEEAEAKEEELTTKKVGFSLENNNNFSSTKKIHGLKKRK
jgi:Ca2+/Na+ antiporter